LNKNISIETENIDENIFEETNEQMKNIVPQSNLRTAR
jgi:hypothetical protein